MIHENILKFMRHKNENTELSSKYDAIINKYAEKNAGHDEMYIAMVEEIVRLANEAGFDFGIDDYRPQQQSQVRPLSDDDLSDVQGGGWFESNPSKVWAICTRRPRECEQRWPYAATDCPDYFDWHAWNAGIVQAPSCSACPWMVYRLA